MGIIGYRNHAQRLISLLDNNPDCELQFIYHPEKKIKDKRGVNEISNLYQCDGVLIASPNFTHLKYIKELLYNSKVKIFCEKPPVNTKKDLEVLENFCLEYKKRIFFNFNMRFSRISEYITRYMNSVELDKIIHVDIISTHGLAFKKGYEKSWRGDGKNNLHNILDTVAIHYLDLLNYHFGKIKNSIYLPSLNSGHGSSYDTSQITLEYGNGEIATIFSSYASPMINEISILGINGYMTIRDGRVIIYSPRDNFDENGFFLQPPIKKEDKFSLEDDYDYSLKHSLEYYLDTIKNDQFFDLFHFTTSISTSKIVINFHD